MKGKKSAIVASLGNGFGIAVGPWKPLVAEGARGKKVAAADGVGGEPPTELVLLPFPTWELEDVTLDTGEESQKLVLADIRARQLDLVCDYHHQSLYAAENGTQAIAAGWFPWTSFAGGKAGIKAATRWTNRADEYLRAGEYRYFSPVVLYDQQSLQVTALLSVALTNTPRTNKQPPLTAELAASVFNKTRRAAGSSDCSFDFADAPSREGGSMKKWVSILCSFLDSLWCYEPKELLAHIDKARAEFEKVMAEDLSAEEMAAAKEFMASLPKDATILEVLAASGELKLKTTDAKKVLSASAETVPEDVLTILELPKGTTKVELKAHLVGLQTSTVPRAKFDELQAELAAERKKGEEALAASRATEKKSKIDALLATYQDRFTPAEEPQVRKLAEADFEAVELNLKNRQPVVAAESQAKSAPPEQPAVVPASTRRVGTDDLPVDPDSAALAASIEAIQKEPGSKFATYEAAYAEHKRRQAAK